MGAGLNKSAIAGVELARLQIIPAPGGPVLKMASGAWPLFDGAPVKFGEIYFSEVLAGEIKAWKRHMRQTQHFAVPAGQIQIVLLDARPDSPTSGNQAQFILGRPEHYALLRIPPGIWYGFRSLGGRDALLCNLADTPHDPADNEKLAPDAFPWPDC